MCASVCVCVETRILTYYIGNNKARTRERERERVSERSKKIK